MKRFIPIALLLLGLLFATCEKEEQMFSNSGSKSELMTQNFKNGIATQSDYLRLLIADIEIIVEDGILNNGNGKALIRHLDNVIRALESGNEDAASDQLIAFIEQIGDFVDEKKLTNDLAEDLIEIPNAINEGFDWECGDPILDLRDGNIYKTVQIGEQCWFAENLAYLPWVSPSADGSDTEPYYYVQNYQGQDVEEAIMTVNYDTYGVLYNWPAAMTSACPDGWHIASDEEWKILEVHLGMSEKEANSYGWGRSLAGVGKKLKSGSGWNGYEEGDINNSGFNALPGGARYFDGNFGYLGGGTLYWTPSEVLLDYAFHRALDWGQEDIYRSIWNGTHSFSVRCIKDTE